MEPTGFYYKITSYHNNHFNALNESMRTFKIDFGKHLDPSWTISTWPLPTRVILHALSYENSFGEHHFWNGKPHVTEIDMNHHATVVFKAKRTQYLKEKRTDCHEKTMVEIFEERFVPIVKEMCPNPCTHRALPSESLLLCTTVFDFMCSEEAWKKMSEEIPDGIDSFYYPCTKVEYEGRLLNHYKIDRSIPDIFTWDKSTKMDSDILMPTNTLANPGNLTVMFSYTFELPETMTVEVENFLVTFEDLIGIVGGTLGVFIGFAFYDNILATLDYIILFWNFAKSFTSSKHGRCLKKETKNRIHPLPSKSEEPTIEKPLSNIAGAETKPAQVSLKPMQTKLQTPASQKQPNTSKKNVQVNTGRKPKDENVVIKKMHTKLENPAPQNQPKNEKKVNINDGTKPKPKQAMV